MNDEEYFDEDTHAYGSTQGLTGAELALWRCFALTGTDVSDGPYNGWQFDAVIEVAAMRAERDALADKLDA